MNTETLFEYVSDPKSVTSRSRILDTITVDGLKCVWNGSIVNNRTVISMSWLFDWNELKDEEIDELSGHIAFTWSNGYEVSEPIRFDVLLTDPVQTVTKTLEVPNWPENCEVVLNFCFKPFRKWVEKYDKMFEILDKNDGILLVEGKECHVNKAFLSYHSDFFQGLFNTRLMESSLKAIPVNEISYADFGLLMSCIYPDAEFPNDKNVLKLLELGQRFLLKSVINHVEYHLLHNSQLDNESKIALADEYKMEKLMEKMIDELKSLEDAKRLKHSIDYIGLADNAKGRILDKFLSLI